MTDDGGPVVQAYALCGLCGLGFWFNPHAVPSLNNRPFCRPCMEAVNVRRAGLGLAPLVIRDDAYDPIPAETL